MEAAVISALAALGGVALAQGFALLQARAARRDATRRLLAEKLEAVLEQVTLGVAHELRLLRTAEGRAVARQEDAAEGLLHARRAYALALLHFPGLVEAARTYKDAADRCGVGFQSYIDDPSPKRRAALLGLIAEVVQPRLAFEVAIADEARRIGPS